MADVQYPFQNPDLPIDERTEDLVSRLELEEKIALMKAGNPPVERLGIPGYHWWNECLHGVGRAGRATVFPQAIGLAASFDEALMFNVACAISDEARAKHHAAVRKGNRDIYFGLTYWSPNINIFRDPRWGRGQETYGEDPYLTARMAISFIHGLQGDDSSYRKLDATAKHYAVHSGPEHNRHSFDAVVDQRDLYETYLPAFKATVQEADVAAVMGAYNRTNGEACCASPTLLQKILREEWGFEGYVVSDCGAIGDIYRHHHLVDTPEEAAAMSVKNGCDLNCGNTYPALLTAVDQGLITEQEIDVALRRLLRARFRLGMFDPEERVPWSDIPGEVVNCPAHRELARQTARESIVLLKNDNNLLPLDPAKLINVAVVGPLAKDMKVLMGNYSGESGCLCTLFEGITAAVDVGTKLQYSRGCHLYRTDEEAETGRQVKNADVVIATLGFSAELEGEEGDAVSITASEGGGDRGIMDLPGRQLEYLKRLHEMGKPIVLVVTGGSPIALQWAVENIPSIVLCWYPGEEGGNAVADVLFGKYNPAGRLPVTFPKCLDDLPGFEDYRMQGRTYRFMEKQPQFRFGYGLSYTRFEYGDLEFEKHTVGPEEGATVRVSVTNVGDRAGDEVVQLYVSDVNASVPVPRLHLEAFRRLHLEPGETRRLEFSLRPGQLAAYDDDGHPFVEPGEFRITVGGGQPDDCLPTVSGTLTVT